MQKQQLYILSILAFFFTCSPHLYAQATAPLPQGFVYLATIDATIKQSVRYYSSHNFLGRRVNGYNKPTIIMTTQTAHALKKVQEELKPLGLGLLVYDAYRPQTAVNDFIAWSEAVADQRMKQQYYPYIDKARVFELGYVAKKSGHSRGSTVDLTLIAPHKNALENDTIREQKRTLTDGTQILFLDDKSVDMGSSFDFFGTVSHPNSDASITAEQQKNRTLLRDLMIKHGFKQSKCEWWHFTLLNEPFPDTYFDFMIA